MIPTAVLALASAFNLSCELRMTAYDGKVAPIVVGELHRDLRIDLSAMRWCQGECEETQPIERVTEAELTLVSEDMPRLSINLTINRESGRYEHRFSLDELWFRELGQCEARPFSGFPRKRF